DVQQGLAHISESLVTAHSLDDFFRRLLPVLLEITGARMAVAFMEEHTGEYFVPMHAIGADTSLMRRFSRKGLEGELGIILSNGEVSSFTSADSGSNLRLVTSFGEIIPAEIITLPISINDEIRAFISLASENLFPLHVHETLEHVRLPLSAGFARVVAGDEIRGLARELSTKNAELTQQSEELIQQSTELTQQSDELSRRNRLLDQQKQELEVATRLKSEFLSNMSHELRTPLNSVLALSRVLAVQGGDRLTEDELGYLAIIERNGRHLLSLINDILDLAKIESGRQDIFFETISVTGIVKEIVDELMPIASEKGISLAMLQPEGEMPPFVIDAKKLRQILQNIVGNAVKFTKEGSVTISLRADSGQMNIAVQDTGIGIDGKFLDTIFHEFRQADGSTSRSFEGTGLGLAIARKLARLMGGDITVSSTIGEGSTFSLQLPIDGRLDKRAQMTEQNIIALPQVTAPHPRHRSILVVDDDPESVSLIASHLSQAGYETITAMNGADALRLARARKPFAITLDILMPDMDGWEIMRELKNSPETADIPVVVVSLTNDQATGFALGAVGMVNKPINRDRLLEEFGKLSGAWFRKVLVVDDNPVDRMFIASMLKESGMDVMLAENGQQALELALKHLPDLITLDLVMPGMDGAAVLDKLRAYKATSTIPVVVITSKDMNEMELSRFSSGVSAILAKEGLGSKQMLDKLVKSLGHLNWNPASTSKQSGSRILIVEDSEAATIQLRFALESAGFAVDAFSNGRHALD
ncbi:MAG: response regulator, partial [Deltaproteobacteria bacterium]